MEGKKIFDRKCKLIIFATRVKKYAIVLQKNCENFCDRIKKNFAEIKRPLTFAPLSKNRVAVMPKDL